MSTYIPINAVHPTVALMRPNDLSEGWQPGLTVNDVGRTHTVLIDDDFSKAIRISTPDGMPGPDAFREWKGTPREVHVYEFVKGNELESQMAFDRWVVDFAHNSVREECGYGPSVDPTDEE